MSKIDELIKGLNETITIEARNNKIDQIINNGLNQTDLEQFKKDVENLILAGTLHSNSDLGRTFLGELFKKYGLEID